MLPIAAGSSCFDSMGWKLIRGNDVDVTRQVHVLKETCADDEKVVKDALELALPV